MGLIVLERRAAVQSDARDAPHGELDQQEITLYAGAIVAGRARWSVPTALSGDVST
jgi:hypothetical protein